MNVRLLVMKTLGRMRRIGLRATIREGFTYLRPQSIRDDFDAKYDTDTGGSQPLWRLRISSPNARYGVKYQATGEEELTDAVNHLRVDPQRFTFIDLGCGKGKTLLVASRLVFKQVIGVEFASELVEIAQNNITKLGLSNVRVIHDDAANFCFPLNDDIVVYLYNPFSQEVLNTVIANLKTSALRRLYVIYKAPYYADLFDTSGFLNRLDSPAARQSIRLWGLAKNTVL